MKTAVALHQNDQLDAVEPRWFAVRTRFKCEKCVQGLLDKKNIQAYVPLQQFVRQYTRKTTRISVPLISCYVFVKINQRDYRGVLETDHVAGFVRTAKSLIAIPEREIQILRRITLEDGLDLLAVEGHLEKGDWVEIVAGNLVGLQGRVVATGHKQQLQVELETLGYSLLITLDAAVLQKLPSAP
ncbi:MAG: UpxY family transcription antiterminator [Lewinellaceae bacterium]|nr:UpxY family transcription antiterminator [Lewinellaceae bacterium]